jgi:hypothetical protein
MSQKQTLKIDDPEHSKRFIEIAKENEADKDEGALDRAFEKIETKLRKSINLSKLALCSLIVAPYFLALFSIFSGRDQF